MTYSRSNYLLIALSVVVILLGLLLMSGGKSPDGETFNPAIFSARRIVVAPIVTLSGFILMFFAILHKPKATKRQDNTQS